MIVFLFDPLTREFCGEYEPQESPLEKGVFITPIHSTKTAPPAAGENKVAVSLGSDAWEVKDDYRGKTVWMPDGTQVEITQIGSLPSGAALTKPKPTADAEMADVWLKIKAERDRRKAGGVKVGAKWFHSDDGSRIQQMCLVMMGASIPANLQWKTMDGTFITMTQTLASQVFQAVVASDQATFAVAEQHKAAMEASTDPASYDFSEGWPKVFGE